MAGNKNAQSTSGGGVAASGAIGAGIPMNDCEKMIQRSLRDPKVKFLKEQLEKSGCKIGKNFIKGYTCKTATGGGYLPGTGIIVCCNHLLLKDQLTQVVIHELIHAYDDCRAKNLNWNYCSHHACSEVILYLKLPFLSYFLFVDVIFGRRKGIVEYGRGSVVVVFVFVIIYGCCISEQIRASHLSGDCHYKRELLRGFVKIRGREQECVKRRVLQALVTNPNCSEMGAKDAMEGVWNICYNDTKPFDTAP